MKRPRKDQRVNVRLDEKLYRQILRLSEQSGESVSVIVRQLLRKSVRDEMEQHKIEA